MAHHPISKLPVIIGHRGACGYAPENTLESIRAAADMGVEWVELDVKLTADDVAIIFHDDKLNRTTNGSGKVAETLWADIKELDAGSWFADSFYEARVPTLEQAVDLLIELGLGLNLEIKPCPGRDVETAQIALDVLSRIWDDHDRILISSFSEIALETVRDMTGGDWAIGYLIDEIPDNWCDIAAHLGAATININGNRNDLKREFIESMIDEGYGILAYTVNDPYRAQELLNWGVDGVFTDEPDVIRDELYSTH